MSETLTIQQGAEEGLKSVFRFLLEHKHVTGIFTLKKLHSNGAVGYALVTDSHDIEDCVPLYPFMPVNAAQSLSTLTLRESFSEPIVACIRPCELRAFVELVKLEQGSLKNILIMSSTCGGVYPLDMAVENTIEGHLEEYWTALQAAEIPADIRPACQGCEYFVPYHSDITVAVVGSANEQSCQLFLHTDKAREFLRDIDNSGSHNVLCKESSDTELNTQEIVAYREKRIAARGEMLSEINLEHGEIDRLLEIYGKCIGCHGCSYVCPICYCALCFFDSKVNEQNAVAYEQEMRKRGGVRVPAKTIFYHIGRLSHVSISCVGCGACTDVCPVNIPV